jgi:hypothetical protein
VISTAAFVNAGPLSACELTVGEREVTNRLDPERHTRPHGTGTETRGNLGSASATTFLEISAKRIERRFAHVVLDPLRIRVGGLGIDA